MVRFKNRWLLVQLLHPSQGVTATWTQLTPQKIYTALKNSLIHNFGEVGWGAVSASLNVKYFSPVTGMAIIRVARDHFRLAWGAVTLLTILDGQRVLPFVVHVSGTIKHVQIAAVKYNRELVAKAKRRASGELSQAGVGGTSFVSTTGRYEDLLEQSSRDIEALQE